MSDNGAGAWRDETISSGGWLLASARKGGGASRIYIEGDGRAFLDRGTPSGDPTPLNPVGLQLAMNDARADVMYVARPCQWVKGPPCRDRTLWTDRRFVQDVVDRYVALVERESDGRPVELVGYSGGAWVALQVASRLPNVTRVVAVAGNLMPDWVNASHKVTRIEVAPYLPFRSDLQVVAYVGRNDKIVKRGVVEAFERATGVSVQVIETGATHGEGWDGLRIP